ncbi:MAG: Lrp/AsnC family transcriptional regulator, leucine-responsive regulatory protein, partial [Pseudonocardiales bacterium]|nr:Lrp/AsnC family transcriptional regulator, leucine-responsive regulatory protein [Pseudonocardiales bacterium]
AVGRGLRVFAGVRLVRHSRADVVAFERAVVRLSEVVHCHHVTGNYDYLLQVEVADLPAYEDFHANRLASLPGVAAVTSYVTMKTLPADTA